MNLLFRHVLLFAFLPLAFTMTPMCNAATAPMHIILDTDMGSDCDDVAALFVLHGAVTRGEVDLLATMGCISADAIAPCLDAMNIWFGHPEIPVGTLKDPGLLVGPHYTSEIARRYPHKFASGKDYPDAVSLYRQVLAKQPDGSVVVAAIGPLRNLANLLRSGPDHASPLDGRALVARKVNRLAVMGGKYPPSASERDGEWNFVQDPAAAALVCSSWPTPILFNGEGGSTNSGRRVTYQMPEHNPLTMAFRLSPGVGFAGDRLSWDPITCLVAVRGAEPWYEIVHGGVNVVDARTGVNTWHAGQDRGHSYLVLKVQKREIETALEDEMVAGKGRPTNLTFNTATYAPFTCFITCKDAANAGTAARKAFDGDDRTAWVDREASTWIQCTYAEGRKYPVTSYVVVCSDRARLPHRLELSGSNDGGISWTRLDTQQAPMFTEQMQRREFAISKAGKWNAYRLGVTAVNASEGTAISTVELNERINCQPGVEATGISLDQRAVKLHVNGRATMNVTITPGGTFERQVAWNSSDPTIAEVRRIGEQVAMVAGRKPGKCILTATIDHVKRNCLVTVLPSTLPTGWSYDELNTPALPGAVSVSNGAFTITGCGHAMTSFWERVRDQGVFVSKPMHGDGAISARLTALGLDVGGNVRSVENTAPAASGLMIREALTEKCGRYLLVQVEASGSLVCRWRDRSGDQDNNEAEPLGKVTLPIHLKLLREGGTIKVFTSSDGQNWGAPRMSHAASFDDRGRAGMFICSGNTFSTAAARFDSVSVGK